MEKVINVNCVFCVNSGYFLKRRNVMKRVMMIVLAVGFLGFMVNIVSAAVYSGDYVDTGTGPSYTYAKDVSSNKDGDDILAVTYFEGYGSPGNSSYAAQLEWHANADGSWFNDADNVYGSNSPNDPEDWGMLVIEFRAPDGYTISSAEIFTRSWLSNSGTHDKRLKATWTTTDVSEGTGLPWKFLDSENDSRVTMFYSRVDDRAEEVGGGTAHTGWDENTTTLSNINSQSLYLCFGTFNDEVWTGGGQRSDPADLKWFYSEDEDQRDPGLSVTLTVVPEPTMMGLLSIGFLGLLRRKRK